MPVLVRVALFRVSMMAPSIKDPFLQLGTSTETNIDLRTRTVELDGKRIKLQISDATGYERFRTVTTECYRGAMGILVVYDVTNASSLNYIRYWFYAIERFAPENVNKILIGNKADTDESKRVVTTDQGQALANEYGIKFFETSAKSHLNVQEVFYSIARDIKQRHVGKYTKAEAAPPMAEADDYDLLIELLLFGNTGVGKSCLLSRFSDGSFNTNFIPTIGVDFKTRTVELDGKRIKLQIWDTAGRKLFRTFTTEYNRGIMGILFVYDVTIESSFNDIKNWIREIKHLAPNYVNKILIGNKADMDEIKLRVVPTSKGQALADEYNIKFFETSARTHLNVQEVFLSIAKDIKKRLVGNDTKAEPPAHDKPAKMKNNEANLYKNSQKSETSEYVSELTSTTQSSNEDDDEDRSLKLFKAIDIEKAIDISKGAKIIGEGGFGIVYRYKIRGSVAAIKILKPDRSFGTKQFRQEATVLVELNHMHLVKLIGVCYDNHALAYEYVENGSVGDYMEEKLVGDTTKKKASELSSQLRTRIIYQTCKALNYVHSRPEPVVHGDLKPDNILLDENMNVKLADFGMCRFLPAGSASKVFVQASAIGGTEDYIDPEYKASGELSPGCDVYSFGITILKILTRKHTATIYKNMRRAFKNETQMSLVDPEAGDWDEAVAKNLAYFGVMCCSSKNDRMNTMRTMEKEVGEIVRLLKLDS